MTTVAVVALVLAAFIILPPLFAPKSVSLPYAAGDAGSYATGSFSCALFTLQHPAILAGGFVTNASVTLSISQVFNLQTDIVCSQPGGHYYTTGDVDRGTLDVSLPAGSYEVTLSFTNETTTQTWFNVTQSFVATY